MLKHSQLTDRIIKAFYDVYNELGHGFLESVYGKDFVIAARDVGLEVQQQVPTPVYFRGQNVGDFRADLLVEKKIFVELKTAKSLDTVHTAQLINYLKATDIEVGILLNFGPKPEFKRVILDAPYKAPRISTDSHGSLKDGRMPL